MSADNEPSPNGAHATVLRSPADAPFASPSGWLSPPFASPNEANAAKPERRKQRSERRISTPIALLFGANAATQFAIQAWLAYGFAAHVWHLAQPLPFFAPVALDLFAVTCMYFAYRLRNSTWQRRAYAWAMLAVAIGAQVGASEGYADHLDWNSWGRIASLFPALFLAASLHALVIVARESDEESRPAQSPAPRSARSPQPTAAPKSPAGRVPTERRPPRPTRQALPPAAGRQRDPRWGDVVRRCLDADPPEPVKTVALELNVGPRTAQLWVSRERARRTSATDRDG